MRAVAIRPKLQRQTSSNPVSDGRFHTAAITPTNDCVPRTTPCGPWILLADLSPRKLLTNTDRVPSVSLTYSPAKER